MAAIVAEDLSKEFRVYRHHRGAMGALRNLATREFSIVRAVDNVGFSVEQGEVVGYLGPNGAGKSTTIKMLTGILVPTSGTVVVNGRVPWRQRKEHVAHIGAVFGQRNALWWDLPVIESFDLLRHIYRVPADRYQRNLATFVDLLHMTEFLDTPVRSLSLGQLMRANLAGALLHDPEVLFLDEPTIGLDVVAKERMRRFVLELNRERGTTVILTTHDLSDVEKLCQRVMMIDAGRLLYDGSLEVLRQRFGGDRQLVVQFAETYSDPRVEGARLLQCDGLQARYAFARDDISASALIARLSSHFRSADLSVREPQIEETVRHIYEQQLLVNTQPR